MGELRGDDLQRTPGYGGHVFAIGMHGNGEINEASSIQTIASQPESWSLLLRPGGKVELDLGSRGILSGVSTSSHCTSVIFSSYFRHHAFAYRTSAAGYARLYIDGQIADERQYLQPLDEPVDLSRPTLIGKPLTSQDTFKGVLTKPIVLNTPITEDGIITASGLDEELCGSRLE